MNLLLLVSGGRRAVAGRLAAWDDRRVLEAGVRHTVEDERRRVLAALVRLRADRVREAGVERFAGGTDSR